MNHRKVVVLSPSDYSLYTLSTIISLRREGLQIAGVGLRRLVNPHRLLFEGRRDGARLLNKIWIKLIRRNQNYKSSCDETISQFLKENDIPLEKVSAVCKREGIPVRRCYDFNENNFVKWVREVGAEVLIFTGGGLLRRPLLEATPKGVLNCHMGILPTYRGMDLPEWAILNGDLDKIGCTVHVMDTGVDTGPILKTFLVPIRREDNIRSLRSRIEYVMCLAVVKTTVDYVKGCIEPQPQSKVDGKQFFIMTESLFKVVESKLARINCTGRK